VKRLAGAALMLGAILVQVTWAPRLTIAGVFPNLALVAVIAITWTSGVRSGMLWACVGGLMLDLTAPGPLGPHAVALLAGAYLTGFWTRNVDRESVLHPMLAAAAGTAAYSIILVTADDTLGLPVPPLGVATQLLVAASLYNAVLMPVALLIIRRRQDAAPAIRASSA
jgi:rod shape-determining protein MreD